MGWCSEFSRERGPAEPRSMYLRSRRRRERDWRRAILQAQVQSHVLKRLLWHRPRDVVAGATGQGDVHGTMIELEVSPASAAPSCCTGSKLSETVKLNVDSETGSFELMGSGLDSISCLRLSPAGVTTYTESGDPSQCRSVLLHMFETE